MIPPLLISDSGRLKNCHIDVDLGPNINTEFNMKCNLKNVIQVYIEHFEVMVHVLFFFCFFSSIESNVMTTHYETYDTCTVSMFMCLVVCLFQQ